MAKCETKVLRPAFEYAFEKGIIKRNPYIGIKAVKETCRKAIEVYKEEEIRKLVSCAKEQWKKYIIELSYRTGMRAGELLALSKDDINWAHNFISITKTSIYVEKKHYFNPPKTPQSKRRIDLDEYTMEILERLCFGKERYLFDNGRGGVYSSQAIKMNKICKIANIRERRFHDLRHTHAATLFMAGVHPKIIQERLGHSTLEFTMKTYGHFLPTIQKAAVNVYRNIPSCSEDARRIGDEIPKNAPYRDSAADVFKSIPSA